MKKPAHLTILLFLLSGMLFAQRHFNSEDFNTRGKTLNDSSWNKRQLTISTDIAQYTFLQPNLDIERVISFHLSVGINIGFVEPDKMFAVNPIAPAQWFYPSTIYKGYVFRFYAKLFPVNRQGYWAIQAVYKAISCDSVHQSDYFGDAMGGSGYTMTERAATYGIDILKGWEFNIANNHLVLDIFTGIGLHSRYRHFLITDQVFSYGNPPPNTNLAILDGTYYRVLTILTPILGLKIGYNFCSK